jgi:hypothetical protein
MYKNAAFMGLVNAGLEYLMRKVVKVRMGLMVLVECVPYCKTWKGSLRSNDDNQSHCFPSGQMLGTWNLPTLEE